MKQPSINLASALVDIERSFGSGAILNLGTAPANEPIDVISTGCRALDEALGVHGLPRGRLTEVYGAEGVGKSSLVLHAIAEAQKVGPCALVDAEHSFDVAYAKAIGVDTDALLFVQPSSSEEAWEISQRLVASGELALLAVDSLAVLLPLAELRGEAGEAHVGLKARQIGQALRRIVPEAHRAGTTILLVNQVRESIGVVYGSPIVVPGGRAPKFAATIRIEVKKGEVVKRKGQSPHKQEIKFRIVKNKAAAPYREAVAWVEYGKGIIDKRGVH